MSLTLLQEYVAPPPQSICASAPAPATVSRTAVITITNEAPASGTCFTPTWIGIHDGSFSVFTLGEAASEALERLAEDGNNAPLMEDFMASPGGVFDFNVGDGPICPGDTVTTEITLDVIEGVTHYFSYATMILPSNDAFVANAAPTTIAIFGENSELIDLAIDVSGSSVLDAGTEVNDEVGSNTAFFGQSTPNTGDDENAVVAIHSGFISADTAGSILNTTTHENSDFTEDGYMIMSISVTSMVTAAPAAVETPSPTTSPTTSPTPVPETVTTMPATGTEAPFPAPVFVTAMPVTGTVAPVRNIFFLLWSSCDM